MIVSLAGLGTAQQPTSLSADKSGKPRTFLAGQASMGRDLSGVETKAFTVTLPMPFKEGQAIPALTSEDQAWSLAKHGMQVGTRQIDYPIWAMVKCADGWHTIFPAILKFKIDMKAGAVLHVDDLQIDSKRAAKAGDSVSIILVNSATGFSMLSIETTQPSAPWFTAYKDGLPPAGRHAALEAWRAARDYVGK